MPEHLIDEDSTDSKAAFDVWRRRIGMVIALPAFFLTWWLVSGKVSPEGAKLSAVMVLTCILWISEAIPLPMTALLAPTLCVILGVTDVSKAMAPFSNPIIFLFIGSFMIAKALEVHRLDRRIAGAIVRLPGIHASPVMLMVAVGLTSTVLSMWISNTATTAMMLPIAIGALGVIAEKRGRSMRTWTFATGMALMVPYAASVGGIGTPVGSPPNLIGIGAIQRLANVEITFLDWMLVCVPMVMMMFAVLTVLLLLLHPPGKPGHPSAHSAAPAPGAGDLPAREPWTLGQISTLIAFAVAVTLWIAPAISGLILGRNHEFAKAFSSAFPESVVALTAAGLLFFLPRGGGGRALNWREAATIDWGTVLLFAGGLALGEMMDATGVSGALGRGVIDLFGAQSQWTLVAVAIAMAIVLSETASNTASAAMLMPVVIPIAIASGVNPVPVAMGAVLGASYGFMLPVSTAPNAIAYGTGLVRIPQMVRAGALFDLAGFCVIWTGLRVLCPLMGWA